ncbi:hypothetical protein C9426_28040 [Serratia sp. S1B]|nr:hypothetical protein C9426_28040 [Serratia sp. S1B]
MKANTIQFSNAVFFKYTTIMVMSLFFNMMNVTLTLFFIFSIPSAYAAQGPMISYIIMPKNMPAMIVNSDVVTQDKPNATIKMHSPAGSYSSLISGSLCVGNMAEINQRSHWLWLEAPNQGESMGINWKFKFDTHNVGPVSSSGRAGRVGYSLVANTLPPTQLTPGLAACTPSGSIQNRDYPATEFNAKVEFDMNSVSSGKKQIIIPLTFALEERWGGDKPSTDASLGMKVGSYMTSGMEVQLKIDLDVQANCDFGGVNSLNLSHGNVNLHTSSKVYSQPIQISCRKGVTAKISFVGDRLPSGMGASGKILDCAGGTCSLLFDVTSGSSNLTDQSSASIFIQDKAQLKVSSLFMPSAQTQPGPFNSNSALVISFE